MVPAAGCSELRTVSQLSRVIISPRGELPAVVRALAVAGVLPEVRDVVAAVRFDAGEVIAGLHRVRRAAPELRNARSLPAARDTLEESVVGLAEERKLVDPVSV